MKSRFKLLVGGGGSLVALAPAVVAGIYAVILEGSARSIAVVLCVMWVFLVVLIAGAAAVVWRSVVRAERRVAELHRHVARLSATNLSQPRRSGDDRIEDALHLLTKDRITRGEWHDFKARVESEAARIASQWSEAVGDVVEQLARTADQVGSVRRGVAETKQLVASSRQVNLRDMAAAQTLQQLFPLRGVPVPITSYSALPATIVELTRLVSEVSPGGLIVETGSGASTLWMALAANASPRPARIVALEHASSYAEQTREALVRNGVDSLVEVRLAPLTSLSDDGGATWYDPAAWKDLRDIEVLFIDGPPASTGPDARRAVVATLSSRLATTARVLVDDTDRDDERRLVDDWLEAETDGRQLRVIDEQERYVLLGF